MTFWAKVLCFLVFMLSVLFMGFEAVNLAKKENWRQRCVKKEEELANETKKWQAEKTDLESTLDIEVQNRDAARKERNTFDRLVKRGETALKKTQTELLDKKKDYDELKRDHAEVVAMAKQWDRRNAALRGEREKLSRELSVARGKLAKQEEEVDGLRRTFSGVKTELAKAKTDLTAALETLKRRDDLLAYLEKNHYEVRDVLEFGPVPEIRGRVLTVDQKSKLVLINVGVKHEVKKGLEFTVFRGDEFVAKIRICQVDKRKGDMSAGRIILEEKPIKIGDHVATRVGR